MSIRINFTRNSPDYFEILKFASVTSKVGIPQISKRKSIHDFQAWKWNIRPNNWKTKTNFTNQKLGTSQPTAAFRNQLWNSVFFSDLASSRSWFHFYLWTTKWPANTAHSRTLWFHSKTGLSNPENNLFIKKNTAKKNPGNRSALIS